MSGSVTWDVMGASVRGASHIRSKQPNQDAIAWYAPAHREDCLILAVSDGHGAPRYLRSHKGAKLAVKLTFEILQEFVANSNAEAELATLPDHADGQLPRSLVRSWQSAVRHDLAAHPFTAAEQLLWDEQSRKSDVDPMRAYGATLLAALVTSRYLLLLQLGDGDILIVDSAGRVSRPPMPNDPRLIANQTMKMASLPQPPICSKPSARKAPTKPVSNFQAGCVLPPKRVVAMIFPLGWPILFIEFNPILRIAYSMLSS